MSTVTLNASATAFPTITNRIRAEVYTQADPSALVDSIIDSTSGHPARMYSFVGLNRTNYLFLLNEIDGGGITVRNICQFVCVPGELDGFLSRESEQIQVDVTAGMVAGATSFTFDGTASKPDYRGWTFAISPVGGQGFLMRGYDYSWDTTTGTFSLLQTGDALQTMQFYEVIFDVQENPIPDSTPVYFDFETNEVTVSTTIDPTYFGKNLLLNPTGVYIEITLPDITTVVSGRRMFVEHKTSSTMKCVKFITHGTDVIDFLDGNLFICPEESFEIYRYSGVWRIRNTDGNFKSVGDIVLSDTYNAINRQQLDGSLLSQTQYARLYHFSQGLDAASRCPYVNWSTGNNVHLFSEASGGNFYIPDRRGIVQLPNPNTRKPGSFANSQVGSHTHPNGMADDRAGGLSDNAFVYNTISTDMPGNATGQLSVTSGPRNFQGTTGIPVGGTLGDDNLPKTVSSNQYILI